MHARFLPFRSSTFSRRCPNLGVWWFPFQTESYFIFSRHHCEWSKASTVNCWAALNLCWNLRYVDDPNALLQFELRYLNREETNRFFPVVFQGGSKLAPHISVYCWVFNYVSKKLACLDPPIVIHLGGHRRPSTRAVSYRVSIANEPEKNQRSSNRAFKREICFCRFPICQSNRVICWKEV